ncbi:MAG: hypothetical protein HYZ83_01980, partial [Candidatus Omnitrophica bacterium]|nr:hypothetical protein [Candidatus Omnitrophota bacterium]
PQLKKQESGFYRNLFDQNIYDEATAYLHLEKAYRKIAGKRLRAGDVNEYDEVPDSSFFTNRHARHGFSQGDLEKGYQESSGPDLSGDLTVTNSSFDDVLPTFSVTDAKGEKYLLKFDSADSPGLATSSEVIASRFYYAMGYNVPQITIIYFDPSKLVPAENAVMVEDSGFKKKLTAEKIQNYTLFLSAESDGRLRASATKILEGEDKGNFYFKGKRKHDPEDNVEHSMRRSLRALRVFSSWLNNHDVREGNTADRLVTENGRTVLKHYLVNFNSSLGSAGEEIKSPMLTHEHLIDYGETAKAFLALGLWEKPWQKRWRESGERITNSPAVGYFDNRYFDPGRFKVGLPNYAFKDLTHADAFWAAKIMMSFSDDDIRAAVKAGELSNSEDTDYLVKTLIERRDMIGKYWFKRSNPLDEFDIKDNKLVFKDLAVQYGFASSEGTVYRVAVYPKRKSAARIASREIRETSLDLENWSTEGAVLVLRTLRSGNSKPTPAVFVEINSQGIAGIVHQD